MKFIKENRIVILSGVIIVGAFIYFLCTNWHTIESSPTSSGVISGLISGAILLIITAALIPYYRNNFLDKADLQITNPQGEPELYPVYGNNGSGLQAITLNIKNNATNYSLKNKIFYHLYIPLDRSKIFGATAFNGGAPKIEGFKNKGEEWTQIDGACTSPLYIKSILMFLRIVIKNGENFPEQLYYYFSTEYGYTPTKAYKALESFERIKAQDIPIEYFNVVKIKKP